jgi:hypothetical protein
MNEIIVRCINYGIACRIGNRIYINSKMKDYPELYEKVLQHELEHSSGYNKKDIYMDLDNKHLNGLKKQYYSFILKNPSSWVEFFPGWFYEGRFVLAPLTALLWGFTFIMIGLIGRLIWS